MIIVTIKKAKLEAVKGDIPDKNWLGRIGCRIGFMAEKIWFWIMNNMHNVMQELLLNGYYLRFFNRLKKEDIDNVDSVEVVVNEVNKLVVHVELSNKEAGLKELRWCVHEMTMGEALGRKNPAKLEKQKKKFEKTFVEKIQKSQKGFRARLSGVKAWFSKTWDGNMKLSLIELCAKYWVLVTIEDTDGDDKK